MKKSIRKLILHIKTLTGNYSAGVLKTVHSSPGAEESAHTEFHSHDYYEVAVLLRGEGSHFWENRVHSMRPGSVFILKPGEWHRYDYSGSISMINFMFSRGFLAKYKKALSGLPGAKEMLFQKGFRCELNVSAPTIAELDILHNRTADEMQMRSPESALLIELYVLNALILILRELRNPSPVPNKHYSDIDTAITYMQKHFNREINLADLARKTGLSSSSFYRKFYRAFEKSPKQWLLELRIRKAGEFLLRSDKKVFEVAEATGFTDSLYFSRLFHRMTGFTPTEYRQREHGVFTIVHDSCSSPYKHREKGT